MAFLFMFLSTSNLGKIGGRKFAIGLGIKASSRIANSSEVYLSLPKIDLYNFHQTLISSLLFSQFGSVYPWYPQSYLRVRDCG
ncbi:MAG: hypothetical protein KME49_27715 [Brasilonema octagenarum HA4186-MV1]|nr:hypothetical protein [Brasilonema octagenarum HA4186-MV1]